MSGKRAASNARIAADRKRLASSQEGAARNLALQILQLGLVPWTSRLAAALFDRMLPTDNFGFAQCTSLKMAIMTRLSDIEVNRDDGETGRAAGGHIGLQRTAKSICNATKLVLLQLSEGASSEATALARAVGGLLKELQAISRARPLADVWPRMEPYFKPFPAFNEYFGDYMEKDKEHHQREFEFMAERGFKIGHDGELMYANGAIVSDSEDEDDGTWGPTKIMVSQIHLRSTHKLPSPTCAGSSDLSESWRR